MFNLTLITGIKPPGKTTRACSLLVGTLEWVSLTFRRGIQIINFSKTSTKDDFWKSLITSMLSPCSGSSEKIVPQAINFGKWIFWVKLDEQLFRKTLGNKYNRALEKAGSHHIKFSCFRIFQNPGVALTHTNKADEKVPFLSAPGHLKVRKNGQQKTCNLSCNIICKRSWMALLHVLPPTSNLSCNKLGC